MATILLLSTHPYSYPYPLPVGGVDGGAATLRRPNYDVGAGSVPAAYLRAQVHARPPGWGWGRIDVLDAICLPQESDNKNSTLKQN